ncbi:1,4-alpha-glucan branching protein GlgB [Faecalicatena fissicatena]|jgi:1,4-alpha-glucan branching enzyme|uniref:1,4-alpha-glucan branching enzyme GlgB n=1 Tax=Faecalicatena fissicatena TaxID=290055 RepID=A0ABX2GZY8_9FIRM|nr:1,4-alpha-glucan branching protein GlgB [Faecalicatena fissicatena]MCB5868126.1 1,4-alpha-glucan branching protein GlgB [Faecalicatena fissicatena]NSD83723.1 1,4-alpha-glucan branching protein GlgB [Faecalicatena fissicatena]NSE56158.1 1,4-alpha-glucan branching protein GlgB [Faecalicatena fissicatena]NSE64914.1 1,4-alpha-glucan branching protein GlgB [Faecalicatena fissicatena]NSG31068.1 1,4-alpha-glucan branching protein GlgB [Faecalicatena fissicatena]
MAERKVRKTAGKTAANTTKRTATKTTAKTAAKRTTRTKAAAKEDFRIGELDQYLFSMGTHYDIYKKMGAHEAVMNGKKGVYFAVWAPNAATVSVIGEFNGWREEANPMTRLEPSGIYEGFVVGAKEGMLYKFFIKTKDGRGLYKADPFANYAEQRPGTASRITDITKLRWSDAAWMEARKQRDNDSLPVSIYEVHPGSWKKHPHGEDEDGFYNYREFAKSLAEYVKEMGYTHVELMGIAEHPFDGSWGYQVTGYYAPTSRYGTPEDFAYMVNYLHKQKIGVILDWVPAHFPRDAHGLEEFDGGCVYEYADPKKGEHPEWGTKVFDFGKSEVKNFLIANALYWVEHFHIDGLRVDAVASILYLDYGRENGQWTPNIYGGNKNLEAIEFFKHLNSVVLGRNHGAMMIAEESTAWPKVTGKPEEDGLGFSHKWNMGWMNDFLEYMKLDPYFRKWNHNKMTFSMTYAYAEKYILVLSHDEVVHLKCSMINKMPGLYDDKFANLRAGYAYMLGHPGKKLLFMGQEFAQLQEWSEARELDWYLLAEDKHQQMQNYVKALLHLYKKTPALYDADQDPCGFEWINADDADRSIFSFVRHSKDGKSNLLFVINFTPVARPDYRVGVPKRKQYRLVLDGDAAEFGGNTTERPVVYKAVKSECDGREYSFAYDLPAYGIAIFKF